MPALYASALTSNSLKYSSSLHVVFFFVCLAEPDHKSYSSRTTMYMTHSLHTCTTLYLFFSDSPSYFKCGWKPYQKAVWLRGFLQLFPPDFGMPPFRRWENLSLLQLFAGNSSLTSFQTSACIIIHLFVFFFFGGGLFFPVVYHLEKRLPQYTPQA